MELRHLRYFVAVAEEKSISRAAARLNMAQPPLGRQIRDLEAQIGADLFRRGGAVLELTAAGEAFLTEARTTLAQSEWAINAARLAAKGTTGTLRVGYISSAFFLNKTIEGFHRYRKAYPTVQIQLSHMSTHEQIAALAAKRIDLGIVHPGSTPTDGYKRRRVCDDTLAAILPLKHKLTKGSSVRLADLAEESFVWFSRATSPAFYDRLFAAFERQNFHPRVVQETDSFPITIVLVAAGE
ncbi:MAG TPA: LysR substrate-binding domain-containing protein, partial [Terriglobales bacterium]|nr:LysR substrate-binding domain-containing protein [Terriglobales bacterium]